MEGDFGKIEFVIPSQVLETLNEGKEGKGVCRTVGKDMDFIADVIRAKRASVVYVCFYLYDNASLVPHLWTGRTYYY